MGCFSTRKCEERRSPSLPRYSTGQRSSAVLSRDSFSLLSNKPVELPDPCTLEGVKNGHKPVIGIVTRRGALEDEDRAQTVNRGAGRSAYSGPLVGHNVEVESRASTMNYFSCDDGKKPGSRSLRRATSFGGRPQPLPLPAGEDTPPRVKQLYSLAPEDARGMALPVPEDAMTRPMAGLLARTRRTRSFQLDDGPARLPLPPPSVAIRLLPNLAKFEFHDVMLATEDFAERFRLDETPFGAVYSARLKDATNNYDSDMDTAVLRRPDNAAQGALEWKAEVQLLAQLSHSNLCAVKGYCTHERVGNRGRRPQRLLVFEQPLNGTLSDHLFGSRCMSTLDWTTRMDIALGAARGLSYIHDRAPLQIVYPEFKAANVLLDEDYSPKLAGYGLSVTLPVHRNPSNVMLSPVHAKLNVWSFGVLLLELLTGKSSREANYFGDANNFVQWGRPFFKAEAKLSHIIDPHIIAVCPVNGVMEVVTLLLQCVNKKDALRPSMSTVVATLQGIKGNHYNTSPAALRGKQGPASWGLLPRGPERQTRHSHSYSDMQTSSDASSSSENESCGLGR